MNESEVEFQLKDIKKAYELSDNIDKACYYIASQYNYSPADLQRDYPDFFKFFETLNDYEIYDRDSQIRFEKEIDNYFDTYSRLGRRSRVNYYLTADPEQFLEDPPT